jgi:hypothetical protein
MFLSHSDAYWEYIPVIIFSIFVFCIDYFYVLLFQVKFCIAGFSYIVLKLL